MEHELDGDVSPIETGLDFVTREQGGLTGFYAVQERRDAGARNQIISLIVDDTNAVPLGHEPIDKDGQIVGQTSSCAFGYRIGRPVALGHSDTLHRHVRDRHGRHCIDPGLCREALKELGRAVPAMRIQITTESAGVYGVRKRACPTVAARNGGA